MKNPTFFELKASAERAMMQYRSIYVLGFAFRDGEVCLIKKERPDWQKGKLNGIGGKLESCESPVGAMVREFREETGAETKPQDWTYFAVPKNPAYTVHCFFTNAPVQTETKTDEEVNWFPISGNWKRSSLRNLKWLIPLALAYEEDAKIVVAEENNELFF